MTNKDKNMKVLKLTLIICGLLIGIIVCFTFNSFKNGFYREWTTMIVGLIGSVFGGFLTVYGVILTLNRTLDMTMVAEKNEIKKKEDEKKDVVNGIKLIIYSELREYFESVNEELVYIIQIYESHQYTLSSLNSVRKLYKLDKEFKTYIHKLLALGEVNNGRLLIRFYDKYLKVNDALNSECDNKLQVLHGMIKMIGEPNNYIKVASYALYEASEAAGTIKRNYTNPAAHEDDLKKFLTEYNNGKYKNLNYLNEEFKSLMEYLNEGI